MITDYFCIVVSMKRSQSGFSIVEGVLIFAIIVLLAFAGWYVFNKNNKQNSSDANTKSVIFIWALRLKIRDGTGT
jgi:high-affinity Fe2+/Pb2+ permease